MPGYFCFVEANATMTSDTASVQAKLDKSEDLEHIEEIALARVTEEDLEE
jgi:hypothetical protein